MELNDSYESIWLNLADVEFKQSWVDVNGVRTRYVQAGSPDKPALIMIHGTGGSWEGFCANIGPHSKHFNCFALDLVGSGYSTKPDYDYDLKCYVDFIHGFMTALGIRKASFIGVSMGAWICSKFALEYPQMTDAITLNAAFGLIAEEQGEVAAILKRRLDAFLTPTWDNVRTVFKNLIHSEQKQIPDLLALRRKIYQQPEMKMAGPHILSLLGPKLHENLIPPEDWRRIRARTLVFMSLNDKPLFQKNAQEIARLVPGAKLVEMAGVAHWPQWENPAEFNRVNLEFLLQK